MNKPTYEELQAQVEALKAAAQQLSFEIAHDPSEPEFKSFGRLQDVMAATPVACLAQVRIPQNANDAAAMALLGTSWLQQNAPERLTDYMNQVRAEAGRAGYLRGHLDAAGSDSEWNKKHSTYHADQYAERIRQEEE